MICVYKRVSTNLVRPPHFIDRVCMHTWLFDVDAGLGAAAAADTTTAAATAGEAGRVLAWELRQWAPKRQVPVAK